MANPSEYCIRVLCRPRPINEQEVKNGGLSATMKFNPITNTVVINDKQQKPYVFDRVFDTDSTQKFVYENAAKQIVTDVLDGYNGTIFVYGQTSSGKTWTMEGEIDDGEKMGIIPRISNDIFKHIEDMNAENVADDVIIHIKIAYFEIYNETIQDLLNPKNPAVLCIREDRNRVPYVKGVTEEFVSNREDLSKFLKIGRDNRKASETSMNERSSRSHSVFQIQIEQENKTKQKKLTGKLHLVDLAGSEKVSKSGVEGMQLVEAIHINQSLSQLGRVIKALADKNEHIPYRDSKLTRILQQSVGGNSRTTIIVCCSPAASNEGETKSTLYFGQCAKTIRNVVGVNEEETLTAEEWKRRYECERDKVMRLKVVENEVKRWRNGEQVPASEWSTISEAVNAKKAVMTSSICESMLKSPGNDMLFGTSQIDQSDDDEKQRYEEELENLNQQIDDKNDELQVQLLELMQNDRSAFDVITNLRTSNQDWDVDESEMSEAEQMDAIEFAKVALQQETEFSDMAAFIKGEFEKTHGGMWCCSVGIFGHYELDTDYIENHYIDYHLGELGIVLFMIKETEPDVDEQIPTGEENFDLPLLISDDEDPYNGEPAAKRRRKEKETMDGSDNKRIKCRICQKRVSKSNFSKHFRIHTGVRPYRCDVCERTFNDHTAFAYHRLIHMGELPYKCVQCGKGFRAKQNLQNHCSLVHSNERPYKCRILCSKKFKRRQDLKSHLRRIHKGKISRNFLQPSIENIDRRQLPERRPIALLYKYRPRRIIIEDFDETETYGAGDILANKRKKRSKAEKQAQNKKDTALKKKRPLRSLLWKYLQKDYKGRDPFKGWATCTMCEHQMQYAFRYGNTYGNLKTHLRIKHAIDF